MPLTTVKPTGKASWPLGLITGGEKVGKTWTLAVASSSSLVHRTFWFTVGEPEPDEFGLIPGVRFEKVPYDGTYRGLLNGIREAAREPKGPKGEPNLIVVDSFTKVWNLLCDMAQDTANARAKRKAEKQKTKFLDAVDYDITPDLWNIAKSRWQHLLDALKEHDGPSLITARIEEITLFENGQPTSRKTMKIQAEKNLAYDVGFIAEIIDIGEAILRGVSSVKMSAELAKNGRKTYRKFTVEQVWKDLGVDVPQNVAKANYRAQDSQASLDAEDPDTRRIALLAQVAMEGERLGLSRQEVAARFGDEYRSQIGTTDDLDGLERFLDRLRMIKAPPAEPAVPSTAPQGDDGTPWAGGEQS